MKPRRTKKRSTRTEAEQRQRFARKERMGGPGIKVPKLRAPPPAPTPSLSGPAQVATQAFRDGWEAIWGPK